MTKTIAILILLVTSAPAQSRPAPTRKTPPAAPPAVSAVAPGTNVSLATVESFLRRMFGQDPSITWQVLDIGPSEAPNIAKVVVVVGGDTRTTTFYVTPDGEHAFLGEIIPFGAEPFEPVRKRLELEATGPRRGAASPEITIVEFSDLQCPHCKAAQPVIDRLAQEFPKARLIFQHYPLPMHKWAAEAASLGVCVSEQSVLAFWKYAQAVFDAQETVPETGASAKLQGLVTQAGANATKAAACAKTPETQKKIQQSVRLGAAVGVSGTPTVFINGRKVPNIKDIPYEQLKSLVEFEAKAGKAAAAQSR